MFTVKGGLYGIALYITVLYCILRYCIVYYGIALYITVLYCILGLHIFPAKSAECIQWDNWTQNAIGYTEVGIKSHKTCDICPTTKLKIGSCCPCQAGGGAPGRLKMVRLKIKTSKAMESPRRTMGGEHHSSADLIKRLTACREPLPRVGV